MAREDKTVTLSREGKIKLENVRKEAGLSQTDLAKSIPISLDTYQRLIGSRSPEGSKRQNVIDVTKKLGLEPTDVIDPIDWYATNNPIPLEFQSIVEETKRGFCGRSYVFEEIESFIKRNSRGYYTIVGHPGMGKSAITSKYVDDYRPICYFNVLLERRNLPELCHKSLRKQLIDRYKLEKAENDDLPTLLTKACKNLPDGDRLVIVIDALDEVEQESGSNILHLPMTLPDRVYFILTRRPYEEKSRRLTVSLETPIEELDLIRSYIDSSRKDVEDYIHSFPKVNPDRADGLYKWIKDRNIDWEDFVQLVAGKSENNFMYLICVLLAIVRGDYRDLNLEDLPDGLQDYYRLHWQRMKMDDNLKKVIILFVLLRLSRIITNITSQLIADVLQEDEDSEYDEYEVQSILNEWVQFFWSQELEEEKRYRIYHTSFFNFLEDKQEMNSNRKIFRNANKCLSKYSRKIIQCE